MAYGEKVTTALVTGFAGTIASAVAIFASTIWVITWLIVFGGKHTRFNF